MSYFYYDINVSKNDTELQVEKLQTEIVKSHKAISILKPEKQTAWNVFITPEAIRKLIAQNVKVYMQYGFGNHNPYSDADYAAVGVDFLENTADLLIAGNVLMKYEAFSANQLHLVTEKKILFSVCLPETMETDYINLINECKITAVCAALIRNSENRRILDELHSKTLSDIGFQLALSNFVSPIVESLALHQNIIGALRHNAQLMNAIYCHLGKLCSEEIANNLNLPFSDVMSLCLDFN